MIVCQCRVVTDRQVETAVAEGARTTAAVCRQTGASQECGSCIFTLRALVCQHQQAELVALETEGAAS